MTGGDIWVSDYIAAYESGPTGDFIGVNYFEYPGTLLVTCRLEFGHRQGIHVDTSRFSYQVNDRYSRHKRMGRFGRRFPQASMYC